MKKLPIGISTFKDIRLDNFLYVDKTSYALSLINGSKYYFLSRPRRFGKSMLLSTLKSIFQGKKELFKDLYIYDKYNFEPHPVISINFTDGDFSKENGLNTKVIEILELTASNLKLKIDKYNDERHFFNQIIRKTYEKTGKQVVVLVDEYDKPILDAINNPIIAKQNKEFLKVFYSVLKANDEFIKFCLLTGVSKFSKVSVFSGLNNLKDITISPAFSEICGYSHKELDDYFSDYLNNVDKEKLAFWYDGYNFMGKNVYNPYDILLFFSENNMYRNYWFESGTPEFLLDLLEQKQYLVPNLDNLKVDERLLNSFEIEKINIETLLFQTGYLTIKKAEENFAGYIYTLNFPNFEVKNSFNNYLFEHLGKVKSPDYKFDTRESFIDCNMNLLYENLYRLFASIPYQAAKINIYEGYYANIIFTHFQTLGLEVNCEERTNKGRIDLVVKTQAHIYLLEFKVGKENALQQIKSKGYHEKYINNKVILIGINFDETERNITNFEWEDVNFTRLLSVETTKK